MTNENDTWMELNESGTLFLHIKERGVWISIIIEHWNERYEFGTYNQFWRQQGV